MVTLVVGVRTNEKVCHVKTISETVDHPTTTQFDIPTTESPLKPGNPKWANYVKGVVANFHGNYISCFNNILFILTKS